MFYCEPCREKNDWPGIVALSYGPCEMCGKTAECYDIPSHLLPVKYVSHMPKNDTVLHHTDITHDGIWRSA